MKTIYGEIVNEETGECFDKCSKTWFKAPILIQVLGKLESGIVINDNITWKEEIKIWKIKS